MVGLWYGINLINLIPNNQAGLTQLHIKTNQYTTIEDRGPLGPYSPSTCMQNRGGGPILWWAGMFLYDEGLLFTDKALIVMRRTIDKVVTKRICLF